MLYGIPQLNSFPIFLHIWNLKLPPHLFKKEVGVEIGADYSYA